MAYDLTFPFRILHLLKTGEEALLRLNNSKVQIKMLPQVLRHFVSFPQAQQPVVHKNAVQIFAYRAVQQDRHDGGIHSAGKSADNMTVSDALLHFPDNALRERGHAPVRHKLRRPEQKIAQHALSVRGVMHFRMKLHGGGVRTLSPWLIQTRVVPAMPSQSAQGAPSRNSAGPYSRVEDFASSPPRFSARSCIP